MARIQAYGGSSVDLFQLTVKELSHDDLDHFACCAWKIWQMRNDFLQGKIIAETVVLVERTMEGLAQYKICMERSKPIVSPAWFSGFSHLITPLCSTVMAS